MRSGVGTQILMVSSSDDPIGRSGLYTRTYRIRGSRKFPVLVEEYRLDRQLLRALHKIENQAAIEMGQWGKQWEDTKTKKVETQTLMDRINAGRDRVAKEKRERDAAAAAKGEAQPGESLGEWAVPAGAPSPSAAGPLPLSSAVQPQ